MDSKENSAPAPRFVGAGACRVHTLRFPVEYDGKVYEKITVTPPTTKAYVEYMTALTEGRECDLNMVDTPTIVMEHLHPDDTEEVNKLIHDFLPRDFKAALEQQATPGNTSSSSKPNSDSPSESASDTPGPDSSPSSTSPVSVEP